MRKNKRYSIVIKTGVETRSLKKYSKEEIIDLISKYNSDIKNKYFLGDINFNYKEYIVTFSKYLKVSMPSTLEEIDHTTLGFINERELRNFYNVSYKNNHKLVVLYRSNRDVKTLLIFYNKDKKFLSAKELPNMLKSYARDIEFIKSLINNKEIESSSRDSIDEFDLLKSLRDSLKYNDKEMVSVTPLIDFYDKFINEKNKFNYFNFRLIASFMKSYLKEPEIITDRKEVYGQTLLDDILLEELRSNYEQMKIDLMDGIVPKRDLK